MTTRLGKFFRGAAALVGAVLIAPVAVVGVPLSLVALGVARYQFANAFRTLDERTSRVQANVTSNKAHIPVVYGRAKLGVKIADIREDTSTGKLWIVGTLCHGSRNGNGIESIHEIYSDEDLAVNSGGSIVGKFAEDGGKLAKYTRTGSTTQTVVSALNTAFPTEWPSSSAGKGIAYVVLRLDPDRDTFASIPDITVIVDGNRVYDPRDTNWKHSDNNALCIRDYMLSTVYGMGIDPSKIDEDSFEDAADFCDELVNVPDGEGGSTTQKRFTCNGVVDTSRPAPDNLQDLLSSCRGRLIYSSGKYRLHIPDTKSAETFELNEDNIIGDWEWGVGGNRDVPNIMRATYVDPDLNYQPHVAQFPEVGESNSYLSADNDFESIRDIDLPFTNNWYMALQIAQVLLNEARQDIVCQVTVKDEALKLQPGEVVNVTHSTPAWSSKPFWVLAMHITQANQLRLTLAEYDAAAYSLITLSDKDTVPDTGLPNPYSVASPTGLTLLCDDTTKLTGGTGGPVPRIKITWTKSTHPWLDYTEIFARKLGDSDWDPIGRVDARDTQLIYVMDVSAGETWEVGIRAVNTLGAKSSMVTDTVAIPDPSEQPHVNDPPSAPSAVELEVVSERTDLISA